MVETGLCTLNFMQPERPSAKAAARCVLRLVRPRSALAWALRRGLIVCGSVCRVQLGEAGSLIQGAAKHGGALAVAGRRGPLPPTGNKRM